MPQNTSRGYTYPLYTDASDFPSQIQDLAQDIDADVQTLVNRINVAYQGAGCAVRASGVNQAIAANTDVTATYAEELYDNASMFDLGTSTSIVNITKTGLYLATGRVTFLSNGNATIGARQISFVSSGSLGTVGRKSVQGHTSVSTAVQLTILFWALAGTTFTMVQRQNSGASLNSSTRQLQVSWLGNL